MTIDRKNCKTDTVRSLSAIGAVTGEFLKKQNRTGDSFIRGAPCYRRQFPETGIDAADGMAVPLVEVARDPPFLNWKIRLHDT